jgi:hypothetical protein
MCGAAKGRALLCSGGGCPQQPPPQPLERPTLFAALGARRRAGRRLRPAVAKQTPGGRGPSASTALRCPTSRRWSAASRRGRYRSGRSTGSAGRSAPGRARMGASTARALPQLAGPETQILTQLGQVLVPRHGSISLSSELPTRRSHSTEIAEAGIDGARRLLGGEALREVLAQAHLTVEDRSPSTSSSTVGFQSHDRSSSRRTMGPLAHP